ncbi:hypothetical protein [Yoonia sp. R2-816]|uniref:hypothetical protein n=1 Tax=Yoonia sp. R2-816 TaxID=3342638 RepID=UPI00372A67DD
MRKTTKSHGEKIVKDIKRATRKHNSGYVNNGHQSNLLPNWQNKTEAESGGSVSIGNHVFSGRLYT